jgi:hypothetical protein
MKPTVFTRSCEIAAPAEALRDWHFAPGAFEKLVPPWEPITPLVPLRGMTEGAVAVFAQNFGPFSLPWIARHHLHAEGFTDVQVWGPFASWEHRHEFLAISPNSSRLVDTIHYRLPGGWIGALVGGWFVRRKLEKMFDYRHRVTREAFCA